MTIHPNPNCVECGDYLDRRGDVVRPHIKAFAERRVMSQRALAVEFMRGVHARHLAGLSLDTEDAA
jgi:hypothetical protein